jgi:hypothetical protein
MRGNNRALFLLIISLLEVATGACLIIWPAGLLAILLGLERSSVDTLLVGRVAGAAVLAIGIASFISRRDVHDTNPLGLLTGILTYNVVVSILLAYAGAVLDMTGFVLWPAVATHAVLAVWCVAIVREASPVAVANTNDPPKDLAR